MIRMTVIYQTNLCQSINTYDSLQHPREMPHSNRNKHKYQGTAHAPSPTWRAGATSSHRLLQCLPKMLKDDLAAGSCHLPTLALVTGGLHTHSYIRCTHQLDRRWCLYFKVICLNVEERTALLLLKKLNCSKLAHKDFPLHF